MAIELNAAWLLTMRGRRFSDSRLSEAALKHCWRRWFGLVCTRCGWQALGACREGDVAVGSGCAEDYDGVAAVDFAVSRLEGVVVEHVAVVYGDDLCSA